MGSALRPDGPDRTHSTGHRVAVGSLLTLTGLVLGAGATWASTAAARTGPGAVPPRTPGRRDVPEEAREKAPREAREEAPGEARVEVSRPERLRRPVLVALGEDLLVHLDGQGTSSGYAWSAVTVPGILAAHVPAPDRPGPQDPDPPARPGVRPGSRPWDTFGFRAVQEGTAKLTFALRRPWEPAAARTVTLTVNVAA